MTESNVHPIFSGIVAAMSPAAPVQFDEAGHRYFVNGIEYPSVTTILAATNLVDYSQSTEFAMLRGSAAHKGIHYDCEGELDESTLSEVLAPYILAARAMRRDTESETIAVERRIFSPSYAYAGTLDYLCKIEGELSVVDWKCSASPQPATALQLAAYSAAYEEETGQRVKRRYCCALHPNGTYRMIPYTDRADIADFRAAVRVVHKQKEYGTNKPKEHGTL